MSIISFSSNIAKSPSLLVSDGCDLPNYDFYGDQKLFAALSKFRLFI